jgi:hypothetical protein
MSAAKVSNLMKGLAFDPQNRQLGSMFWMLNRMQHGSTRHERRIGAGRVFLEHHRCRD